MIDLDSRKFPYHDFAVPLGQQATTMMSRVRLELSPTYEILAARLYLTNLRLKRPCVVSVIQF